MRFTNGMFEGEFQNGLPNGFGRTVWDSGMSYHGAHRDQLM